MKLLPVILRRHCAPGGRPLPWFFIAAVIFCFAPPRPLFAAKSKTEFIFYPPAPGEPRLQFLASYSTEADLGPKPSKFARFLVGDEPPRQVLVKPYGLALSQGKLYVCDPGRHGISILDLAKREFSYLDQRSEREVDIPINLVIDQDGTRYVADRGRNQVLIFSPRDEFVGAIGPRAAPKTEQKTNTPPMEVTPLGTLREMWPTSVGVTKDRIYVADLNNNCVRVYQKLTHQLLFLIPGDPKDEASKLFAPINLILDPQGRLYVSDMGGFFIKQFDPEGKHLRTLGQSGDRPGEFVRPKGLALDRQARLYVVDAATQLIQVFDAQGQLLLFFGEPGGSAAPLDLPAQVIIDYDHFYLFQKLAAPGFKLEYLVLVSNQYGDRKVSVYGFGHRQ